MSGPLIYYMRHGETDWNTELRFQGQRDIPLNDTGREQAKRNGKKLAELLGKAEGFEFISSPLSRSRETMEIVRTQMGLEPGDYALDERLREMSYGAFEGRTQAEIKAENRELYYYRKNNAWTFQPDGGESHAVLLERIADWYSDLNDDQPYVVAAHGAVGRVLRHHITGIAPEDVARYPFPQDQIFKFSGASEQLF